MNKTPSDRKRGEAAKECFVNRTIKFGTEKQRQGREWEKEETEKIPSEKEGTETDG